MTKHSSLFHRRIFVKKCYNIGPGGLYYKHTTIINYASSIVNKLEALLTDNARVVIYDCHVFIVQATGLVNIGKAC
jgi:hypothetical protein